MGIFNFGGCLTEKKIETNKNLQDCGAQKWDTLYVDPAKI